MKTNSKTKVKSPYATMSAEKIRAQKPLPVGEPKGSPITGGDLRAKRG